jgi:hypothetical protein
LHEERRKHGKANMTKQIVAFSSFADAGKKLKEKKLGTRDALRWLGNYYVGGRGL